MSNPKQGRNRQLRAGESSKASDSIAVLLPARPRPAEHQRDRAPAHNSCSPVRALLTRASIAQRCDSFCCIAGSPRFRDAATARGQAMPIFAKIQGKTLYADNDDDEELPAVWKSNFTARSC